MCARFVAIEKLDGWLARRRAIAARYTGAFSQMPELTPPFVKPESNPAWHLYVIRLNLERLRVGRAEIFRALRAENIGVNVHYIPVPWHPYYQQLGYQKGKWRIAEDAYERILSLPMFPAMTDDDVSDVIEAMRKVLTAFRK
jgi:dTDP-4-amino-4,6-dideoxygalactose transaminase